MLVTIVSVLFILVLPRKPQGLEKLTLIVNKSVHYSFVALSRLARTYEGKDSILAPTAPVALIAQLLWWAASLVLGFALMLMDTTHSFAHGLTQALTSLFTVGAIHIGGVPNTALDIAAGATWVVIVALQIAYLPSLYNSFSRREALVTMLESRAGSPAWGPELLARHQLVGINDALPQLYADWEQWAAEVTESHTTYPVLLLFRSPEPWLNWIVGLLAVLDAGAMQLALNPSTAPSQTRLCLRMGFTLFNRLAGSLGYPVDPDPDPDSEITLVVRRVRQCRRQARAGAASRWSEARKRPGRTFAAGGSTTRARPTAWPTPSRLRSRRGRAPVETSAPASSSRVARRTGPRPASPSSSTPARRW